MFIPLPPLRWATVGWLSPSTQGPSSCQMDLSTQYSVSDSGHQAVPSPFRPRGGDNTQLLQPRGTELSLRPPTPL